MDDPAVKVKRLHPKAKLPERATPDATGYDLYARLDNPVEVGTDPVRITTGIAIEAPRGFDVQIRPRSGLSAQGVIVTFGTIDSDYRGELLVNMYALPGKPHVVHDGDRIAQLVIAQFLAPGFLEEVKLSRTKRGGGGHGSTGR